MMNSNRPNYEKIMKDSTPSVIWITGVTGSGKTTLAKNLQGMLKAKNIIILDGDVMREELTKHLGFTSRERLEQAVVASQIAKMMMKCGAVSIVALVSPTKEIREEAKAVIGEENMVLIWCSKGDQQLKLRDMGKPYEPPIKEADIIVPMTTLNETQAAIFVYNELTKIIIGRANVALAEKE